MTVIYVFSGGDSSAENYGTSECEILLLLFFFTVWPSTYYSVRPREYEFHVTCSNRLHVKSKPGSNRKFPPEFEINATSILSGVPTTILGQWSAHGHVCSEGGSAGIVGL